MERNLLHEGAYVICRQGDYAQRSNDGIALGGSPIAVVCALSEGGQSDQCQETKERSKRLLGPVAAWCMHPCIVSPEL